MLNSENSSLCLTVIQVLPELAKAVNTLDVFADMRALFQYRVLSNHYKQLMEEDEGARIAFNHFQEKKMQPWYPKIVSR